MLFHYNKGTSTVHDTEEIEESGQTDAKRTVVLGGAKDKKSKKSKKQAITFRYNKERKRKNLHLEET